MKMWIWIVPALAIAACGGGEGEPDETPVAVVTSGTHAGSGAGGSASGGYGNGSPGDFCHTAISVFWCNDANDPAGSNAAAVHSQVSDTEPNDDLINAVSVHWPRNTTAGQRIGFGVEGTVSSTHDVADFFSFTPQRGADFFISLCETGQTCGPWNADHRLDIAAASVRILDQFGVEIFSDSLHPGSANVFETRFEAGVLYYAVVVAEGFSGNLQSYRLIVGESLQQKGEDEPSSATPTPEAPEISAHIIDAYMNVQFDWTIPTFNRDGTQLTDLAGYKLYLYDYIREGDAAERRLIETINDPSVTTRTINLDGYRDWYVSITAFNEAGIESAHSNGVELASPPD